MNFFESTSLNFSQVGSRDNPLQAIFILFILGSFLLFNGLKNFKLRRKIQDTPTSKIISAPQGFVEIQGLAWPASSMHCLFGRNVCFYEIQIQKYKKQGKNSSWVTVYKKTSDRNFLVFDETGVAHVNPQNANFHLKEKIISIHNLHQPQYDQLFKFAPHSLQHLPDQSKNIFLNFLSSSTRLIEKKIYAGSPVLIKGQFQTQFETTSAALGEFDHFRKQLPKIVEKYKSGRFDTNKDGQTNFEEALLGLTLTANPFVKKNTVEKVKIQGELISATDNALIIAEGFQEHLLNQLSNFKIYGFIITGIFLICSSIYVLLNQIQLENL